MNQFSPPKTAHTPYVFSPNDTECEAALSIAGRAVIARVLDFDVAWVSADTQQITGDASAATEGFASGHRHQMTNFDVYIRTIVKKQAPLSKGDLETVMDYCVMLLAGSSSESLIDPENFDHSHSATSHEKVEMILRLVDCDRAARTKLLEAVVLRTGVLVSEFLLEILLLREDLLRLRMVTGPDIDDLIA